jgi:predicted metal-binding membrane protein
MNDMNAPMTDMGNPMAEMGDSTAGMNGSMSGMGDSTMDMSSSMSDMSEPTADVSSPMTNLMQFRSWTASDALLMFTMWSVMMVAMMIPSATPFILLYALVCRKRATASQPFVPSAAFLTGYVVVWIVFSLVATVFQWVLEQAALLSSMLISTSQILGGIVLIAAGIYQGLPYKNVCLRKCRTPVDFLSRYWQPGIRGAFNMGLRHGLFCLGCCWLLMALLFVGGVMNLLWVAAIAIFILVEKLAPFGEVVSRISAALFVVAGAVSLIAV